MGPKRSPSAWIRQDQRLHHRHLRGGHRRDRFGLLTEDSAWSLECPRGKYLDIVCTIGNDILQGCFAFKMAVFSDLFFCFRSQMLKLIVQNCLHKNCKGLVMIQGSFVSEATALSTAPSVTGSNQKVAQFTLVSCPNNFCIKTCVFQNSSKSPNIWASIVRNFYA